MAWSKRWFITQAMGELGYADYIYELAPEKLQQCLNRLDTMIAQWNFDTINVGWPLPTSETSSTLDQQTNVEDGAHQAIIANLAIRIAPTVGKTPSAETKDAAATGYESLVQREVLANTPQRGRDSRLPLGAGNKPVRNAQFILPEADDTIDSPNGKLEF